MEADDLGHTAVAASSLLPYRGFGVAWQKPTLRTLALASLLAAPAWDVGVLGALPQHRPHDLQRAPTPSNSLVFSPVKAGKCS